MSWNTVPSDDVIAKVVSALTANGFKAQVASTRQEAKTHALALIPEGSEVMNMTSVTLDTLGISDAIMESGKYKPVKKTLMSMDRATQGRQMQALGAAPDWSIASVHAVTENGEMLIASNTGSQLPAAAYGASHVVFVVGAQKIVKNVEDGIKRIYEYTLPLESERAKKAYGVPGSNVSKLLILNKEVMPDRIHVIIIKDNIGF